MQVILDEKIRSWSRSYTNLLLEATDLSINELLVLSGSDLSEHVWLLDDDAHARLYSNLLHIAESGTREVYEGIANSEVHIALHFGLLDRDPELTVRRGAFVFDHVLLQDIATRTLAIRQKVGRDRVNYRILQILRVIRCLDEFLEAGYVAFVPQPFFARELSGAISQAAFTGHPSLSIPYLLGCMLGVTPFTTGSTSISRTLTALTDPELAKGSVSGRVIRDLALADILEDVVSPKGTLPWIASAPTAELLRIASNFKGFRTGLREFLRVEGWHEMSKSERAELRALRVSELRDTLQKEMNQARKWPGWDDVVRHTGAIALVAFVPDPISKAIGGAIELANLYSTFSKVFWRPKTTNPFFLGMMDLQRRKYRG